MSVSDPLLKLLKRHVFDLHTLNESSHPAPASSNGTPHKNPSTSFLTDDHPALVALCESLEPIFRKGLKIQRGITSEPWDWIETIPSYSCASVKDTQYALFESYVRKTLDDIRADKKVHTPLGRTRMFIRAVLHSHNMRRLVQFCCRLTTLSDTWYDNRSSILGNEILSEIFSSLCFELDRIEFHFHLKNTPFLDFGWNLPAYVETEIVPCSVIGLYFLVLEGFIIVMNVEKGSVAADGRLIEQGDIIIEIDQQSTYNVSLMKVMPLFRNCRLKPLSLGILKSRSRHNPHVICSPIKTLLERNDRYLEIIRALGDSLATTLPYPATPKPQSSQTAPAAPKQRSSAEDPLLDLTEVDLLQLNSTDEVTSTIENNDFPVPNSPDGEQAPKSTADAGSKARPDGETEELLEGLTDKAAESGEKKPSEFKQGHPLEYLVKFHGSIRVGPDGRAPQVAVGINGVLSQANHQIQDVVLDLGEGEVAMFVPATDAPDAGRKIMGRYSYTLISVCGRRNVHEKYFAFIVGDTTCSMAKNFICYVYEASNEVEAKHILKGISQGFDRTLWLL